MHESCPACGGSTSVGRTRLRRELEKSRSRATGASNTTSLAEPQRGSRRSATAVHQRTQSIASSGGIAPRLCVLVHQSARPSTAARQAVTLSASAISSNDGGQVEDTRLLSVTARSGTVLERPRRLAEAS